MAIVRRSPASRSCPKGHGFAHVRSDMKRWKVGATRPVSRGTRAAISRRMAQKLVIVLAHGGNDDRSSVAFTIANAAMSGGMQVAVFLTSDGVELSKDGSCDLTQVQPFKKLDELID